MDNVSSIKIGYEFIRKPKFKSNNIFEYAAKFEFLINQECYLMIEDFAILDFAIKLYKWLQENNGDFLFNPSDHTEIILEIKEFENHYSLFSIWSDSKKEYKVDKDCLINSLNDFINRFIKDFESSGDSFKKQVKNSDKI